MLRLRRGYNYTSSAASGIFPSSSARGRQLGAAQNSAPHYRVARHARFPPQFRHRATAINASALCECTTEKMWRLRRGYNNTSSAASGIFPSSYARGRQKGCGAKFSNALMFGEAAPVLHAVPNRATAIFSSALSDCEATTVSSVTSTPGNRNNRIRRCVKAPLKNIELWRYCGIISYYNLPLANGGSRKVNGGFEHG